MFISQLIAAPHVDSIKFSGDMIAGISLLSTRTMVLSPEGDPASSRDPVADIALRLPPRSLYVLRGKYRYDYRHEILGPFSRSRLHLYGDNNSGGSSNSSSSSQAGSSGGDGINSSSSSDGFDRRMSIIFRNEK